MMRILWSAQKARFARTTSSRRNDYAQQCFLVIASYFATSAAAKPITGPHLVASTRCLLSHLRTCQLHHGIQDARRRKDGGRHLLFSTTADDDDATTTALPLREQIALAFASKETDGILELAAEEIDDDMIDANSLLDISLQAVQGNKGQAAAIFNAWIASSSRPERALELLAAFDARNDVEPDMVTLCLTYDAVQQSGGDDILERAVRMAKKQAGSKRRKALAAARRKPVATALEAESLLQELLNEDFCVLHETPDLLLVSKPSGTSCYHAKTTTTAGKTGKKKNNNPNNEKKDMSLVDALLECNVPLSTLNPDAQGIVHRLDRGTSGCLLLAKTDAMHAQLVAKFFSRQVHKEYMVLTAPAPKLNDNDWIALTSPVDGRPAHSEYQLVERFGNAAAALGRVQTKTGRKHQVRVHCANELQSPVLGDALYGNASDDRHRDSFYLHASSLSIPSLEIDATTAPMPAWWQPTLEHFRKDSAED